MEKKDTKQEIFDTALELFAKKGYKEVSIREIAAAVGIKESSIYNHYNGKQEILDSIFKKFKHSYNNITFSKKDIEKWVQEIPPEEVLKKFVIIFPEDELEFMIYAYKIICAQQFIDPKARDLAMFTTVRRISKYFEYTLNRLMYYNKIPKTNAKYFGLIWSDAIFTRLIKIIHSYDDDIYKVYREEYIACKEFLINIIVKGVRE